MTTRISVESFATILAQRELSKKNLSSSERRQLMPATRYTVMVRAFHVGAALLVSAVALGIFAKFATAAVFGGIGYVLYTMMDRALSKIERNPDGSEPVCDEQAGRNVLRNLGLPEDSDTPDGSYWRPNRVVLGDFVLVKHYLPEVDPAGIRERSFENPESYELNLGPLMGLMTEIVSKVGSYVGGKFNGSPQKKRGEREMEELSSRRQ